MKLFCFIGFVLLVSVVHPIRATHLRAVEITAKRLHCNSYTYEVTITGYIAMGGASFGGADATLHFGDGTIMHITEQPFTVIDAQLHVGMVQVNVLHTYRAPGFYVLSYSEPNRNGGILNMDASINTLFYTESGLLVQPGQCNSTPMFLVPPIDRACRGITFFHNPGASDADDDSLSYELVVPLQRKGNAVRDYAYPDHRKFYEAAGLDYNRSNEEQNSPPRLFIDPVTGLLTWDAPGATGEYAVAIKVTEWKFNTTDGTWYTSGYVVRDMQIIVEECNNRKPILHGQDFWCVTAGEKVSFTVRGFDPDLHDVVIETFSDALTLPSGSAAANPNGIVIQSTQPPHDTAAVHVIWNTTCDHVRNQPYAITFKISDRPASGPRLVSFKTVFIKVRATEPVYEQVKVNPVSKEVTLQWKGEGCANITAFQVWRRVARYAYNSTACDNGMPHFLRYQLLAEVPTTATSFTDNTVAIGALYCYRIVALIGSNKVASKISMDTCLIPKPAEAPVITNVSVMTTHPSNGEITVRWTRPFDIDVSQYPPPYTYKVYRSTGTQQGMYQSVTPTPIADTTFTDTQINTTIAHSYWIELYVPALTQQPVDSSDVASSVFSTASAGAAHISLSWEARAPWYNYLQRYPYHRIYRSTSLHGDFILIDSVDVNEHGFTYTDPGTFQQQPLQQGTTYYYKVLTRGSYGNPKIAEPLDNFSQAVGTMLLDLTPPCTPALTIVKKNCVELPCSGDLFYNELVFSFPENTCPDEGIYFEVFVSSNGSADDFEKIAATPSPSFRHDNLSRQAMCYKVRAIKPSGVSSEDSNIACADNCAYFELPNIFSPGNRDGKNDQFAAFSTASAQPSRCARFVKNVDMVIYNRWGEEVFSITGVNPEKEFIFWDGLSGAGHEVSPGIYYYQALVEYDVRDPQEQQKQIKGWVQVMR